MRLPQGKELEQRDGAPKEKTKLYYQLVERNQAIKSGINEYKKAYLEREVKETYEEDGKENVEVFIVRGDRRDKTRVKMDLVNWLSKKTVNNY